jgi:hypothetical protein
LRNAQETTVEVIEGLGGKGTSGKSGESEKEWVLSTLLEEMLYRRKQ